MAWSAFVFGICISPCDNVAAAPKLSVFAIAVAACPPLALLVAVELLNRAFNRHCVETESATAETGRTNDQRKPVVHLTTVPNESRPPADPTAMQRMWAHYITERSKGCANRRGSGPDRGQEQLQPEGPATVTDRSVGGLPR